MQQYSFHAFDEDDTQRLGKLLARALPSTATIALHGTLGAGKTRLVQALAAGCGVPAGEVTSPTFVLCQPYHADRTLYHLDAYRVRDLDEFLELGVEEYFAGPGITLIEWAERVADCLPREKLEVHIEITGELCRKFTLVAHGAALEQMLEQLVPQLDGGAP